MTKEFLEIVLTQMINERDMCKLDMNTILLSTEPLEDKVKRFRCSIREYRELEKDIEFLDKIFPEESDNPKG
jgi:hypothetical protein